ncbi:MAG TPA: acetyl-CoA carboxylase biotin carboxyl carrier protein [Pyrinomonadaceae bacterium]|jgi:acetyl-CoA carboxylase biotin carboxyl carrier protein|nr:acetyl-CoA carboxylase biotin carboxyl carrier protein [Pyrinomonadaceae bacterium]
MSAPKENGETGGKRNRAAPRPPASVNMEELRELIGLLRDNGLAELELENEGFRVRLRRESGASESSAHVATPPSPPVAAPAPAPVHAPAHPGTQATTAAAQDQDLHIIPSPIVGTFYRSASPTADPFVKIGSNVEPESVVCIIEAMKLMNEIQAEATGEVVKIYVENGQPVEYGQPLFGIRS